MLFTMCFTARKDAMGNSYKDIVNAIDGKENTICMIPLGYEEKEFSNSFRLKYKEHFSTEKKGFLYRKIYLLIKIFKFIKDFKKLKSKYNIKKILIYPDNRLIYPILSFFLSNIEIICWIHDPILHSGDSTVGKINRFLNAKLLFKRVSKFIVSYSLGKEELAFKYKIDRKKIYSVNLPRMSSMEFENIKEQNIKIKYDFIFFGRIEEYKGIDLLINTLRKYQELNKYRFLIVGTGNKSDFVKENIQSLSNIEFINKYVSDKQLAKYIKQSKYVILPYKDATGSQTIQIANYYDKLVLATKVGCFTEYIIERENGIFIEKYTEEAVKKGILNIVKYGNEIKIDKIKESLNRFNINSVSSQVYKIIKNENAGIV